MVECFRYPVASRPADLFGTENRRQLRVLLTIAADPRHLGARPWLSGCPAHLESEIAAIADHQILEKLDVDWMGVVYKARDTHLDRLVALKVLPPEKVADPERKRRFVQEAKAASALNHPNIITIDDIASENGNDFIVMEYVQGKTLDALVPRKGLRLNEILLSQET
jgi:hypothetical protein